MKRRVALMFGAASTVILLLAPPRADAQPVYPHPDPAAGESFFALAQAYRLMPRGNATFSGDRRLRRTVGAVEGILELAARQTGASPPIVLDAAAFATCRTSVESSPVVLDLKLTKVIPGSALYPATYQLQTFIQLGNNIRTHWTLLYDQPGTTFTLDVHVSCTSQSTGLQVDHIDRYTWKVVATPESLHALIDALHTHAFGTSGIPPISSESTFRTLHAYVDEVETKLGQGDIVGAKATIASMSTFVSTAPGILTTLENPAIEALRVALEYLNSTL
jgi:hypothetical protein